MKVLIVKLGALGNVARITVLLQELKGEIHWLSKNMSRDLLGSKSIHNRYFIENPVDIERLKKLDFDWVICLDEKLGILKLISEIKKKKLTGTFLNKSGEIDYTPMSKYWFDMSLISELGIKRADELKHANKKTVPQILIEMIGKKFVGQKYDLGIEPKKSSHKRVGLIKMCSSIWQNKQWRWHWELFDKLKAEGYEPVFLEFRSALRKHIEDINSCETIVCGDTLGMHIAMALGKNVVAMFNCTPAKEIEEYGNIVKIVSPLCEKYLYNKDWILEPIESIPMKKVYGEIVNFYK